jgi:N-acetylmuramoyl-L-alanine amidase
MKRNFDLAKKNSARASRKLRGRYTAAAVFLILVMSAAGCSKTSNEKETTTEVAASSEAESIPDTEEQQTPPDSSVLKDNEAGTKVDSEGFTILDDYVIVKGDNVNVRVKPNTEADIYLVLQSGVDLHRTGEKDGWTRVKLNGSSFYVSSNYVEVTEINWKQNEKRSENSKVIFIDPSKQITADTETEQMAPGSSTTKARMSAANIGVSTGNFEYDITLSLAQKLKAILETRGYTVKLSRDTSSVSISNRERALLADAELADVYLKLQAGSASEDVKGLMGFIVTANNDNNGDDYNRSYELCKKVLDGAATETGTGKRGIVETDKLTTLNYCNMPSAVINVGFLSNKEDDIRLSKEEYIGKLAEGIANGIDEYYGTVRTLEDNTTNQQETATEQSNTDDSQDDAGNQDSSNDSNDSQGDSESSQDDSSGQDGSDGSQDDANGQGDSDETQNDASDQGETDGSQDDMSDQE